MLNCLLKSFDKLLFQETFLTMLTMRLLNLKKYKHYCQEKP